MTWVRIDDQFPEHEKVMAVSVPARWLHVTGLCYCARNLTDGHLTAQQVRVVCAVSEVPRAKQHIAQLVDAGLWIALEEGAYEINDYTEFNPSSEQVKEQRLKNAQRQAKFRARRNNPVGDGATNDVRNNVSSDAPLPNPIPDVGSKEEALSRDAGLLLKGTVNHKELVRRLILACGGGLEAHQKIQRTVLKHKPSEFDLLETIRAATGPGVESALSVALAELKRRGEERSAA